MLRLTIALVALVFSFIATANADEWVNGYFKKDGTYVQGYFRSDNDNQKWNNYSTKGNTNPWNGKEGTKKSDDDYYQGSFKHETHENDESEDVERSKNTYKSLHDIYQLSPQNKEYVKSYYRKDGSYVRGYYRNK